MTSSIRLSECSTRIEEAGNHEGSRARCQPAAPSIRGGRACRGRAMMDAMLRVAVQDHRRLVREELAALFIAEPAVQSASPVASLDELTGIVDRGDLDVIVHSADPADAWSESSLRLHRLTDAATASCLIAAVCGDLVRPTLASDRPVSERPARLTIREAEILRRVADGMSSPQVALSLGISPRTVENHKQRIFAKLGVRSQAHAVALATSVRQSASGAGGPVSVKVLVADPVPLTREIVAEASTRGAVGDVVCVGAVGSLGELRSVSERSRPQVVLSACWFADGELLDAMPALLSTGARVLLLATSTPTDSVSALLLAGASGCLSIDECGQADVLAGVRTVAAGHAALHPSVAAAVLRQWRTMRASTASVTARSEPPTLTSREIEVLSALARGLPTKTIARELSVSPKTVEAHISRLLSKLGARNRAHAISVARSYGLFDGQPI